MVSIKLHKGESIKQNVGNFCKIWSINGVTQDAIEEQIRTHLIENKMYEETVEGKRWIEIYRA